MHGLGSGSRIVGPGRRQVVGHWADEMEILVQAGFVSVDEIDGALIVGFADREFETSGYFMLQRSLDPDDDGRVYLEHTDQAYGSYASVSSCSLSRSRLELTVDDTAAERLDTECTFAVGFSCDDTAFGRVRSGLVRVFSGTDCRLLLADGT